MDDFRIIELLQQIKRRLTIITVVMLLPFLLGALIFLVSVVFGIMLWPYS